MKNPRTLQLFDEYAASHRHPMNRLTHKIAIPLIVFHILAMLDWTYVSTAAIPGGRISLGMIAWVVAAGWYLWADTRLGLLVIAASSLAFPLGRAMPWWSIVAIAIGGWLVQLAGHVVWEKKQPSFMTNLVHALVGPLFFVALLTGAYRIDEGGARQPTAA